MGRSWCARSGPLGQRRSGGALPGRLAPLRGRSCGPRRAGAVLVPDSLAEPPRVRAARIVVPRPVRGAGAASSARSSRPTAPPPGIDPTARLGPGLRAGRRTSSIGPFVVLGRGRPPGRPLRGSADGVSLGDGVTIGEDTVIGPRVVCYAGSRIGRRVVIKAGAVHRRRRVRLSFRTRAGTSRIPHVGGCILEDEVEIGSNSCVDRGSLDDTVIGAGTKIDNLVHVGHNVRIGQRCLLMAGVGIAGSTRIGNDVILAGHVGVTDHLVIGDRVPDRGQERGVRRRPGRRRPSADIPRGPTASSSAPRPRSTGWRRSSTSSSAWRRRARARWLGARWRGRAAVEGIGLHTGREATARCVGRAVGPGHRVPADRPRRRAEDPRARRRGAVHRASHRARRRRRARCRPSSTCSPRRRRSQLDDLTVELDGPEPPIGDGSFAPFLDALNEAGIAEQPGEPVVYRVLAPFQLTEGDSTYVVAPAPALRLTTTIEWAHPLIGRQTGAYDITPDEFARELARRAHLRLPSRGRSPAGAGAGPRRRARLHAGL